MTPPLVDGRDGLARTLLIVALGFGQAATLWIVSDVRDRVTRLESIAITRGAR